MNRDDIQMWSVQAQLPQNYMTDEAMWLDRLERFAALVAAAEREECAKVCENAPEPDGRDLAERIRARGQA